MCTVIYLPQKNGALFSSCRDENPARLTIPPKVILCNNTSILCPQDKEKSGTWIGANEKGTAAILLNGGFESHIKMGNYTHSRGLIVLELLTTSDIITTWTVLSLINIEPFTLVVWHRGKLCQLTWDGQKKHMEQLDAHKPAMWSSSTLYNKPAKDLRSTWFNNISHKTSALNEETLLHFLRQHNDRQNGFVMHRSDALKTVSISIMRLKTTKISLTYFDLVNQTNNMADLKLNYTSYALEVENIPDKN